MTLLGLPTEVLHNIIQDAMPEGFESMMLTCKILNTFGTPFVDGYNRYKRKWGTVDVEDLDSDIKTVGEFLLQVSKNPMIGRYIDHAKLWIGYEDDDADRTEVCYNDARVRLWERLGGDMQLGITNEEMVRLREERAGLDLLSVTDEEAKNYRFLRAVISLLTLLPNVKMLHLPKQWQVIIGDTLKNNDDKNSTAIDIWYVLDMLVSDSNSRDFSRRPLANLQRLCYIFPGGADEYHGFRSLVPFLAMPHVTELYTSS